MNLGELPLCLIIILIFSLLTYQLSNQINDNNTRLAYMAVHTAGVLTAQGMGFAVGTIATSNDKLGIVLANGLYLINVFVCGFFTPIEALPTVIRWLPNISFVKQSYELIAYIFYGFDRCPDGQVSVVLDQLKLNDRNQSWINAEILIGQIIFYRTFALVTMLIKANKRRIGSLARLFK